MFDSCNLLACPDNGRQDLPASRRGSGFNISSGKYIALGNRGDESAARVYRFFAWHVDALYHIVSVEIIPRWISIWGLAAVIPYLAAALLDVVGLTDPQSASSSIMFFPMSIQEMVMAVWLIVKGFDPSDDCGPVS